MLNYYFFSDPKHWIIPWIIESVAYYFVLKKMALRTWMAIVPFVAEHEFSTVEFRKMRSFWRPFAVTAVLVVCGLFLGRHEPLGVAYMIAAYIVYGIFLLRLYCRIAKSFGKPAIYGWLTAALPPLFLLILGFGKSKYEIPEFKPRRAYGKFFSEMRKVTFAAISVLEIIVLVGGIGFLTIKTRLPKPLSVMVQRELYDIIKDVKVSDRCITREKALGKDANFLDSVSPARDKFFPDHSRDEKVVVMEYMIGSNLEDSLGSASTNIRMIKDATKRGDGLTFVLEAGGSRRWYTRGIQDNSHARYTVSGGKLEKTLDLGDESMIERSTLDP